MQSDGKSARRMIVALLACFSLVSFVLRMNISIASKLMMPEFGLTQIQMGQVFGVFMLGYALFQIPAGILGDRWGPRRVLGLAALWWGITTMLTAFIPGTLVRSSLGAFGALFATRFLLGVGESATYPVATRAIANWVPASGRALSNAIVIAGATIGSALTPPLIAWLMIHYGWRTSFYVTGFIAFILSFVWWAASSDSPEHRKARKRGESSPEFDATKRAANVIAARARWKAIYRNRNLWILSISYMCDGYVLFIFVFWLYTYLTDVRGFSLLHGGLFASLPFTVASIMTPMGGHLCDRLCVRFGPRRGRRITPVGCLLLSGVFLFWGAKAHNPYIAIAVLSLSVGFIESTEGAYWLTVTDIGQDSAGGAGGVMNMFGNFGGAISTALVPVLVSHFGWLVALGSGTVLALVGALLWFWVHTERDSPADPMASTVLTTDLLS